MFKLPCLIQVGNIGRLRAFGYDELIDFGVLNSDWILNERDNVITIQNVYPTCDPRFCDVEEYIYLCLGNSVIINTRYVNFRSVDFFVTSTFCGETTFYRLYNNKVLAHNRYPILYFPLALEPEEHKHISPVSSSMAAFVRVMTPDFSFVVSNCRRYREDFGLEDFLGVNYRGVCMVSGVPSYPRVSHEYFQASDPWCLYVAEDGRKVREIRIRCMDHVARARAVEEYRGDLVMLLPSFRFLIVVKLKT
ncbi:hypothetical protein CRV027 [Nile crocodilepox virus]|uniref:Uncharacterized protein n=1 Tax=Nile crocodilepox virus (isolate Crocodylus niloticus/Zimbabwe/Ume/2001) TaxID=1289473 RepID=Q070M4_CPRVZ|nr:hypothetical protein CRV027 [Nile crocodilepox virus]ABJ08918.1 hypothetical protein CRV027 [Nile crocodilepox virus]